MVPWAYVSQLPNPKLYPDRFWAPDFRAWCC